MKILQLIYESPDSPFGFGGAGVRAYKIYEHLGERHDITFVCMRYPGARDATFRGIRHIFLGTESKSLFKSFFLYALKSGLFIRKHGSEYDVIVENFLPASPFFTPFFTKTPVILQIQGIMERHILNRFSYVFSVPMYLIELIYPRFYEKFVFVSEVTRDKILSRIHKPNISSVVIPNAADDELFEVEPGEEDYILFMSRIETYTKGLDVLVKAFERVSSECPDVRLILAGSEFTSFHDLVAGSSMEAKDRIEYAGFVTGEEKKKLMSGAKIFVLPSRHESSPISILEAAACGKAVLVTDIPELAFVRESNIGLTCVAGDRDSCAEKLICLLKDENLRKKLGENGRQYAKQFTWKQSALLFEDVLKGYLKDRQGRKRGS